MSSQRPQPVLMDMPKHILEKIIEGTGDFKERLPLRQVSRPFRHIIDRLPLHLQHLTLWINKNSIEFSIVFENNFSIFSKKFEKDPSAPLNFNDLAARDLLIFIDNRRLKIDILKVHSNSENEEFLKILFGAKNNSNFALKTKEISLYQKGTPPLEFFDFLDKKSLKSINIQSEKSIDSEIFDKNFFEKFENVKNLDINTLETPILIGKLRKFENLVFEVEKIEVEDFEQILKHFIHSSSIRSYRILCANIDRNPLISLLETADLKMVDGKTFRREFQNLKNPTASFAVTVYSTTIEFSRIRKY
ncbi:unnamed protein product [Caenorhabditis brenneri]